MSPPERPWMPGPNDQPPGSIYLINPKGDRHLGFNQQEGRFYRIWQFEPPEPLHTGQAILLRPSEIDQIIKISIAWVISHSADPRGYEIGDELAVGAKAVVQHFAGLARGDR